MLEHFASVGVIRGSKQGSDVAAGEPVNHRKSSLNEEEITVWLEMHIPGRRQSAEGRHNRGMTDGGGGLECVGTGGWKGGD